jgi:hypothetical protein
MIRRFVSVLVLAAAVAASLAFAQNASPRVTVDDNYILALATADEFLHAWAHRDADAGRTLLTPAALQRNAADQVTTMFQGTSSPHHESYEIGPGRRLTATKYAFDVIQYEYLTGMNASDPRPTPSHLVVVEVAPGRWLVDEFPAS